MLAINENYLGSFGILYKKLKGPMHEREHSHLAPSFGESKLYFALNIG